MVAAGDQRRPRRRAKRGGVELCVTQARLGDAVQVRRRNDTAEGAGYAVALIIGHDEEHVGRVLGRDDTGRPPGRRVLGGFLDYTAEGRRRCGELLPIDGGGGGGRAQLSCDLLSLGTQRGEQTQRKSGDRRSESRKLKNPALHTLRSLS